MGGDVGFKILPHVIAAIAAAWAIINALLGPAFDLVDRYRIMRRGAFVWVLIILGKVSLWTLDFASNAAIANGDKAAIIAAVWTPMAMLQGAIFKFYDDSRSA